MEENEDFYVKVANGNNENSVAPRVMSHCNGRNGISVRSNQELRQVISMEEVTCKLKGIKVSLILLMMMINVTLYLSV
jgi:hypothetical protein